MAGKRRPKVSPQRRAILDLLFEDEQVVFFEPAKLDGAIIGLSEIQPGRGTRCVVYAYTKLKDLHVSALGMPADDVEEWLEFNTLGAWLGDGTPIVLIGVG